MGALDKAFKDLNKELGDSFVCKKEDLVRKRLSSPKLTYLLGGGVVAGRMYEFFGEESSGKSLGCQIIAQNYLKDEKHVVYLDLERTFDPTFAKRLGLNVDSDYFHVIKVDSGEDAYTTMEKLVSTGELGLVIVDSVANMTSNAELEGGMNDSQMGDRARLMGKGIRKLIPIIDKNEVPMIFINQTRMKIGVMFGCFHYDTLVNFADGRSIPIGEVVKNKIEGDIFCLNEKTNEIEVKPIIDWHLNGKVKERKDFIHIQTTSINGKGRFGFTCTPNHRILTNTGWKEAKDLNFDDRLISKYTEEINGTLEYFLNGTIVGDCSVKVRAKNTAGLTFQDNKNQAYMKWKVEKLSKFFKFSEIKIKQGIRYDSNYNYELSKIKKDLGNKNPLYMLKRFNPLSLAVWIMDDGHLDLKNSHCRYILSAKRYKNTEVLEQIADIFTNLGFTLSYNSNNGRFTFNTKSSKKIAKLICNYIPECMQYKLPEEYRGKYKDFELFNSPTIVQDEVKIKEIRKASKRQMRDKQKFDITVKDNSNYMVGGKYNGIIVHNSPETTTGGKALPFATSYRGKFLKAKDIIKNDEKIGITVKLKTVKNKIGNSYRTIEIDIYFDGGIDPIREYLELADNLGLLEKSGTWYTLDTGKVQGMSKVIEFYKKEENKEAYEALKLKVDNELFFNTTENITD